MTAPDPELSPRRAARAEAERRATAAITLPEAAGESTNGSGPRAGEPVTRPRGSAGDRPPRAPADHEGETGEPEAYLRRARRVVHASPARLRRRRVAAVAATTAVIALFAVAVGAAASGARNSGTNADTGDPGVAAALAGPPAVPADGLPVPSQSAAPAPSSPCDLPAFTSALSAHDDGAAIAAVGGGEAFRAAVVAGLAPCVSLSDPTHQWVVVNKQRPYDPVDYQPADLTMPDGVRALEESALRAPAASALTALVRAADDAGVGEIGFLSAFRSYSTQQSTYAGRVSVGGVAEADRESARAGYSEHQSGLAVDIVPCGRTCGTLDDVAGSTQGAWVRDNAWQYGFITRYADGRESVSGYEPEPWHLRYLGPELARAYHDGGYTTLEEFFGLPAAPTY